MPKHARDAHGDNAEAPASKKQATAPSVNHFAALPLALQQHIWSYSTYMKINDHACENANHQLLKYSLAQQQLVCRAWNNNVKQIIRDRLQNVVVLDVAAAARGRAKDATDKLVIPLGRDDVDAVTDVRVMMGDTISKMGHGDSSVWSDSEQALVSFRVLRDRSLNKSVPEIDWEATLGPCAASITRLDLQRMLIYDKNLGDILRAAGKLCPNVKDLLLPLQEEKRFRNEEVRLDNMKALSEAMEQWHKSNGGLTRLCVQFIGMKSEVVTQLVTDVTKFCPDLEYFDGYAQTFQMQAGLEFITCDLFLPVGLIEWMNLWKALPKLRQFNTVIVPSSMLYYTMMCAKDVEAKEHLEELTISHNSVLYGGPDGFDGELFDEMMEKFPALRKLSVVFGDEQEWAYGEVFDDNFLEAVAKHNTKLEEFSLHTFSSTDVTLLGVKHLVGMEHIRKISIDHGAMLLEDGSGMAPFVQELIKTKRQIRLSLTFECIDDSIWEVLTLLKDLTPEEVAGASFSLSLRAKETYGYKPSEMDEKNGFLHTEEEVHALYKEVKKIHGNTLRLHLHITQPTNPDDGEKVQFDSLDLSINDPQGFKCCRDKAIDIANETIEQELCGEDIRVEGVYVRDPEGALEDLEHAEHWKNKRMRSVHLTGITSDDEHGSDEEGGEDGMYFDFDDGEEFDEGDDDGEDDDEDDEDEDEDGEGEDDDEE